LQSHEDIEELLESHLMDCNTLGEKIVYLLVTIQNAEDLVRESSIFTILFVDCCFQYEITRATTVHSISLLKILSHNTSNCRILKTTEFKLNTSQAGSGRCTLFPLPLPLPLLCT
jgi:hypothetical protein